MSRVIGGRGELRDSAYINYKDFKVKKIFEPTIEIVEQLRQLAHTAATMKILLLLSLLFSLLVPFQVSTKNDGSPLTVSSFKWSRARRNAETAATDGTPPARAMIPQNRIFARNARVNDPAGARDPNADTLDGRSAAMEKSVAESRATNTGPVDGFAYRIKVQNVSEKIVEAVFWEYQFRDPANPDLVARRQFLCVVNIGAGKGKELEGFSLSGPSDVVDVKTLADNSANPFKENVLINRVEYTDGSISQRKTWNMAEVKASYDRVLHEKWVPGTCKGL